MGLVGPVRNGMIEQLGVGLDHRGDVLADESYMTTCRVLSLRGRRYAAGPSLLVWAIAEGRKASRGVDQYLMGSSKLP